MDKNTIDRLKQSGIISQLEDLMVTLGGEATTAPTGRVVAKLTSKQVTLHKLARVNGAGTAGPDFTGITPAGRVVEGDYIPAAPVKITADEMRSLMAFDPADWAHGPSAPMQWVTVSAPCTGHSKPQRPSSIVSISQAELDRLLAPYIRYGLLRTIYTTTTRATEYRGPSGKLIAITIGRNHYRARDAVLGSTPRNIPAHMLLTKDQIRESSVGAGKSVVIPFPGGAV